VEVEHQVRGEAYKLGQGQHKIICPSCSHSRKKKTEKTLSLRIENEKALFKCWHCHIEGIIPMRDEMPEVKQRISPVATHVKEEPLSDNAVQWLNDRGISKSTAEFAGVKSTKRYIQSVGSETECVMFPYRNQGQEYAFKIRSLEGKGFSCNGAPQTFFNVEGIQNEKEIIICEGEMDALAFMEAGITNVVSVPNGAVMKVVDKQVSQLDDTKFQFLWKSKEAIENADKIIIATDNDSAGEAMAEEMARRIGRDKCWKFDYPHGCKDANDILSIFGSEALKEIVEFSKPWPVAGLFDAEHFYDEVDVIYDRGMGKGESTGYTNVDELYSIVGGQLTIVTGHPSSGKSEFIDQIMVNMAERSGWRFAICSFENEPRLHIAKLISKWLEKPFFKGITPRMTKEELRAGKNFVQSNFSFLYQADGSLSSIDSIIERLKVAVMRHGIRGAVIDPYNYIEKNRDSSETDWISEILTKLRVFAQAHDIHLWFVAHPTKMMRGMDGNVPVPKGYDISGSAAWFAKADVGLSVHRPDPAMSPISEIHIWKCRFSWIGKQGQTDLEFDVPTSSYRQPAASYQWLNSDLDDTPHWSDKSDFGI